MSNSTEKSIFINGIWDIVKEAFCQKILTWNLSSSPLFRLGELSGVTVIVTGATSGIGLNTAREFAMAGADVTMACRNTKLANDIANEWRAEAHEKIDLKVEVLPLDLLSLSSVHSFAKEWDKRAKPLHILINNAGVVYLKEPQGFSEDGIERHIQVNHIATALLTLLLLPSLRKAPSARIINVNSVAHHCAVVDPSHWNSRIDDTKFHYLKIYGESKLAQLMFLKALAMKLFEKNITSIKSISVNPGSVNTKMVNQEPVTEWKLFYLFSPAQASRSVLFCATNMSALENLQNGFAFYNYTCKTAKISSQANDPHLCELVWDKTLNILKLQKDYLDHILDA